MEDFYPNNPQPCLAHEDGPAVYCRTCYPMTDEDIVVVDWQFRRRGSFYTALFEAIKCADLNNQAKLKLAYPLETGAIQRFQHEPGYADNLRARGLL